jgi:hypothetical protein
VNEEQHRRNIEKIEISKLSQNRESINKNLQAQHRLMIATLIAAAVALVSALAAIFISISSEPPVVNVSPSAPAEVNISIPKEDAHKRQKN